VCQAWSNPACLLLLTVARILRPRVGSAASSSPGLVRKGRCAAVLPPVRDDYSIGFPSGAWISVAPLQPMTCLDDDGRNLTCCTSALTTASGMSCRERTLPTRFASTTESIHQATTSELLSHVNKCAGLPSFPATIRKKDLATRVFVQSPATGVGPGRDGIQSIFGNCVET